MIIRNLLQKFIDDIDANNTNLSYEQQCSIIKILSNVNIGQENEMNKTQAADYLGVSRATFDNYIRDGFKYPELIWRKEKSNYHLR